jgi:uncharacterized membrane-anchored protein
LKKASAYLLLLNLLFVLAYFLWTVRSKEDLLKDGKQVFLELAPVDPRSLMQGDFMRLDYGIAQNQDLDTIPTRGYCVVRLDGRGIAQRVRMQKGREPLGADEYLIPYIKGRSNVQLGANSFFFQEGKAWLYDSARFGALRVDRRGNTLLTGLYDRTLRELK